MFACSHSGPAAAVGDLPELPPGGSEVSRLCRPTAAAGGVARALHPCLLALSDGAAACQRRVVREVVADAAHQRVGQLHLVGAAAQPGLFLGVADEGGFHQHAGNVGRLEHGKPGLLHARLVQLGDRKSTRLNSSHLVISYAVFCLKKKNTLATHLSPPTSTHAGIVLNFRRPALQSLIHARALIFYFLKESCLTTPLTPKRRHDVSD